MECGCDIGIWFLSSTLRSTPGEDYEQLIQILIQIEQAVEEQIARIRVRMLEAVVADGPKQEQPICQACGTTMVVRSQAERQLTVQGDEAVHLHRSYAVCPSCGTGLFPLDEEVVLLPSSFSPFVHQCIVRLGTLVPFEQVPEQLAFLTGVCVSKETVRRLTEQAGAAQVAVEVEELRQVPREAEPRRVPEEGEVQQLSADGAMIPLLHGIWAEVRTVTIGIVGEQVGPKGREVHAHDISYFSRLCRAADFIDWAALPLHQRGTEQAETVVAVTDGASCAVGSGTGRGAGSGRNCGGRCTSSDASDESGDG